VTTENNKRIVKNTFSLFFRLIFTLAISLYVSRIVLKALGVDDFGIYSVVGSIVTMLSFMTSALSTTTQRFISYELGNKTTKGLVKLFSMAVNVHIILAVLILVVSEIIGVWVINTKLNIPVDRLDAALIVFHLSLFTVFVNIVITPYNAAIISYERMGVVAWLSIIESLFKLSGAFYLAYNSAIDNLILYASTLALISVFIKLLNIVYCHCFLKDIYFKLLWEHSLFRSLLIFSGWSLWGGLAYVLMVHGVNILINIFFGPVVNAARAIANQVQGAVLQFSSSFQMAMNPQIVKNFAISDFTQMKQIVIYGAKYTYFLLLMLIVPVIIETELILKLWLGEFPEYTVIFVRLMLLVVLIESLSNTLMVAMQATGRIALYQTVVGGILILNLPLSYFFLSSGYPPYITIIIGFALSCFTLVIRLFFLRNIISLDIKDFFYKVIVKIFLVTAISILGPTFIHHNVDDDFIRLFSVFFSSTVMIFIMIYFVGLEKLEQKFLYDKIKMIQHKFKRDN
jgi:O-antigen/teichoic acid export membrane protein